MNLSLLAPELSLFATVVAVILLDLLTSRPRLLLGVLLLGVAVSGAFSIGLWNVAPQSAFNGALSVDRFAIFFKWLVLAAVVLVGLSSVDFLPRVRKSEGEYLALVGMSAVGLMLLAATRDFISIFIALELSSISLYSLAAFLRDPKSSEAGLKYLLVGSVASSVLLYGMTLVYGMTGDTRLDHVAGAIQSAGLSGVLDNPVLLMGLVLIVAGFGFKIASFPFQMWVPDVYEGAPTPITGFLSVASKAAGFAVIVRIFDTAFGAPGWLTESWGMLFAILATITMTVGNITAIAQANIKRMMGYSSIAQAGYVMVGLAAISASQGAASEVRSAIAFFLASYTLTNVGAFIAIVAASSKLGTDYIEGYSGLGKRAPVLSLALTLCFMSLLGLPPTAGLIAKIYIFAGAVQQGFMWLVIVAVVNTVISAFYYLRVVKLMWLAKPLEEEPVPSSGALRTALVLSSTGILVLGIIPTVVIRLAELAGRSLS